MVKLRKEILALRAAQAIVDARLFSIEHPHQVISSIPFEEKEFGDSGSLDKAFQAIGSTKDIAPDLSTIVVSLALFDEDRMLFACSGVALPPGTTSLELTRFVTSRRLVEEFEKYRNVDDKLRIEVCLPDCTHIDGFLGLYDDNIAIVTSFNEFPHAVCPVDLDLEAPPLDTKAIVAARAFKSGRLMITSGRLTGDGRAHWKQISEAAVGGPVVDHNGKLLGVNLRIEDPRPWFIPLKDLHGRLKHFQILNTNTKDFHGYSLSEGVSSIIPSGFWRRIKWIESVGYPIPPPLVLEFNGELLETFEDEFGELRAWKEYPYPVSNPGSTEHVWALLPKDVVTNISLSVVRLASFDGSVRCFACTGLLIKWPGTKGMRPVILTSASLVRSCGDHFKIDKNLRIDVFLPPRQHAKGTLVFYHLNTNIAIIRLEQAIRGIHPVDICSEEDLYKPVVAVARQIEEGFLMASKGKVCLDKSSLIDSMFPVSTCKISKAGIGGPLINFDGTFVGMNHYDGSEETTFLPRLKIVEILKGEVNQRKKGDFSMTCCYLGRHILIFTTPQCFFQPHHTTMLVCSGLSMRVLHGVGSGIRQRRYFLSVP
nr:uncharacterized protein LOC123497873 isoform X2 [Aegilops tauschii subsp. strangulata]